MPESSKLVRGGGDHHWETGAWGQTSPARASPQLSLQLPLKEP